MIALAEQQESEREAKSEETKYQTVQLESQSLFL
jgi:hypothetical protein